MNPFGNVKPAGVGPGVVLLSPSWTEYRKNKTTWRIGTVVPSERSFLRLSADTHVVCSQGQEKDIPTSKEHGEQ